jgi:methionyl aminopeptidase
MIVIKSESEIEIMRKSGRITGSLLNKLRKILRPGVTTKELDKFAEDFIRKRGAVPAFKGYGGYPASLCASINEEVVHGIPSKRRLKDGDIIGLDTGAIYKGYYSDAAITVPVGKITEEKKRLIRITEEAFYRGIEKARPGNRLSDISSAIQKYVEKNGFSIVREFCGHGVGRMLHEDPQIPNYGEPNRGPRLKPGMTFAIEPMVNAGTYRVKILSNGWTAVTADGRPSSHFENTIVITDERPEILTISNKE